MEKSSLSGESHSQWALGTALDVAFGQGRHKQVSKLIEELVSAATKALLARHGLLFLRPLRNAIVRCIVHYNAHPIFFLLHLIVLL